MNIWEFLEKNRELLFESSHERVHLRITVARIVRELIASQKWTRVKASKCSISRRSAWTTSQWKCKSPSSCPTPKTCPASSSLRRSHRSAPTARRPIATTHCSLACFWNSSRITSTPASCRSTSSTHRSHRLLTRQAQAVAVNRPPSRLLRCSRPSLKIATWRRRQVRRQRRGQRGLVFVRVSFEWAWHVRSTSTRWRRISTLKMNLSMTATETLTRVHETAPFFHMTRKKERTCLPFQLCLRYMHLKCILIPPHRERFVKFKKKWKICFICVVKIKSQQIYI